MTNHQTKRLRGPVGAKRKALRARRWEHANEVVETFEREGVHVTQFPSSDTPHLRIAGVDYWPATSRFYDLHTGETGFGFEELKKHVGLDSLTDEPFSTEAK